MTKFSVINAETEISVKWFDSQEEAKYAKFLTSKHNTKFIIVSVEA